VRPVKNVTDPVTVKFKLKLSQLIDVVSFGREQECWTNTLQNLRNQIMTTNLWVEQFWFDHKLVTAQHGLNA
jgi:nicotinic acetylcholine receptor